MLINIKLISEMQRIKANVKGVLTQSQMTGRRWTSSGASDKVLVEEINNKGVLTLNRVKTLNAIDQDMVRQITTKLREWESKMDFVIIKGAGEKAFCCGGDIRGLYGLGPGNIPYNFLREEYSMNAIIGAYRKPYIALIDGITMGGGAGLAVHGKYRIATERTLFAMPETAIGIFPDFGCSYFLSRLPGKLGLFLGLTGYRLKGTDVLKAGVATHYIESKDLPNLEQQLLNTKHSNEIEAVLNSVCQKVIPDFSIRPHMEQINKSFGADSVEGIIRNLENDGNDFAQELLKMLRKMSPTSLKLTKAQLELGINKSLNECIQMEYRMACHCLSSKNNDFYEGVRALLVDKDQKPKWNPKSLEEVTDAHIDGFFKPLTVTEELQLDFSPGDKQFPRGKL